MESASNSQSSLNNPTTAQNSSYVHRPLPLNNENSHILKSNRNCNRSQPNQPKENSSNQNNGTTLSNLSSVEKHF